MKKRVLLIASLALGYAGGTFAQDMRRYIPNDIQLLAEIDGREVHKYIKEPALQTHFLTKPFIEEFVNNFTDDADEFRLETLGINSDARSYYYYKYTDSIAYTVQMYELKDVHTFTEKMAALETVAMKDAGNFRCVKFGEHMYVWNTSILYIIKGDLHTYYYYSRKNNPYGLKNVNFYDFYDYQEDHDEEDEETVMVAVDTTVTTYTTEAVTAADDADDDEWEDSDEDDDADTMVMPPPAALDWNSTSSSPEYKAAMASYDSAYGRQQQIRDSIADLLTLQYIEELSRNRSSILDDKNFRKTSRSNRYANVYVKNIHQLLKRDYTYGYFNAFGSLSGISPYEYYNMNLEIDRGKVVLHYEVGMTRQQARQYRKIEQRKLNKKLLKYVNMDRNIAGFSYAFNTENYMHYSYDMLKRMVSGKTFIGESQKILVDVMELLLDEKAIGKAYKGDGLFLVTGITPYKYTYTSYDYEEDEDGDFTYKETKKEKEDNLPDFLFMYSTENPAIHRKLLEYALQTEAVSKKNGIYTFKISDNSPYSLHLLVKDGIVFLGTSIREMEAIAFGHYKNRTTCGLRKQFRKNTVYGFAHPQKLQNLVKTDELTRSIRINNTLGSLGDFEWTHPKLKCGKRSKGKITAYTPSATDNGMDYILNTIDNILDLTR